MNLVWLALLAPTLVACVEQEGEPRDDDADVSPEDTAGVDEAAALAVCIAPPTPPAYDRRWTLSSSNPSDEATVDPPNSGCADYVIGARNAEGIQVALTSPATTPDQCVGTVLTVRKYSQASNSLAWTAAGVVTASGVWTVTGCRLPTFAWPAHTTGEARIHITSRRTYTSGQFIVNLGGLPFHASAQVFVPGPN